VGVPALTVRHDTDFEPLAAAETGAAPLAAAIAAGGGPTRVVVQQLECKVRPSPDRVDVVDTGSSDLNVLPSQVQVPSDGQSGQVMCEVPFGRTIKG
jgi:hypothetical protein